MRELNLKEQNSVNGGNFLVLPLAAIALTSIIKIAIKVIKENTNA